MSGRSLDTPQGGREAVPHDPPQRLPVTADRREESRSMSASRAAAPVLDRLRIGSAPDSWGVWFPDDEQQVPWRRFLDEVTEAGYEWIELGPYGYLPTDPAA